MQTSDKQSEKNFDIRNSINNGKDIDIQHHTIDIKNYNTKKNLINTAVDGFFDGMKSNKDHKMIKNLKAIKNAIGDSIEQNSENFSKNNFKIGGTIKSTYDQMQDFSTGVKATSHEVITDLFNKMGSVFSNLLSNHIDENNTNKVRQGLELIKKIGTDLAEIPIPTSPNFLIDQAKDMIKGVASTQLAKDTLSAFKEGYRGNYQLKDAHKAFQSGTQKAYQDSTKTLKPIISAIIDTSAPEQMDVLKDTLKSHINSVRYERIESDVFAIKNYQKNIQDKSAKLEKDLFKFLDNEGGKIQESKNHIFLDVIGRMQGIKETEYLNSVSKYEGIINNKDLSGSKKSELGDAILPEKRALKKELNEFEKITSKINAKQSLTYEDTKFCKDQFLKMKENYPNKIGHLFDSDKEISTYNNMIKQSTQQLSALLVNTMDKLGSAKDGLVNVIKTSIENTMGVAGAIINKVAGKERVTGDMDSGIEMTSTNAMATINEQSKQNPSTLNTNTDFETKSKEPKTKYQEIELQDINTNKTKKIIISSEIIKKLARMQNSKIGDDNTNISNHKQKDKNFSKSL